MQRSAVHWKLGSRGVGAQQVAVRRLDVPGKQLADAVNWIVGDAREHVAQKCFGIVAIEFRTVQ